MIGCFVASIFCFVQLGEANRRNEKAHTVDLVAVLLNDGTVLSPRSTFGDLVAAWNRALVGRLDSDLVKLTGIFERLNGDDVLGGCE